MESRDFAKKTQYGYLLSINQFLNWLQTCTEQSRGKDDIQATKPDILRYLEHLKNRGLQNITRNNHLTYINHYFTFLYLDEKITENPCLFLKIRGTKRKKINKLYAPEELDTLFDAYYQLFVRVYDDPSPTITSGFEQGTKRPDIEYFC